MAPNFVNPADIFILNHVLQVGSITVVRLHIKGYLHKQEAITTRVYQT